MYGHKKKACLEQNMSYGTRSFHASFHHFLSCFYVHEMSTKASNAFLNLGQISQTQSKGSQNPRMRQLPSLFKHIMVYFYELHNQ